MAARATASGRGRQVPRVGIDLNTGACVHWFRIDGPVAELYDVGVVPDVVRPMSLSFASNEILRLTTHDPLEEGGI
jgi:hypothetical protein